MHCNAFNFCLNNFIPLTKCFINLEDENGDDIDDDELFFKRREREIQGHNGNDFLISSFENIFRLVRIARELLGNMWQ